MPNGTEPIEWQILDKQDDKLFVASKYALDYKQFSDDSGITWKTSPLRKWLNEDFLQSFDDLEKDKIVSTSGDKVSLLSLYEANAYFRTDEERKAAPTPYAMRKGAFVENQSEVTGKVGCVYFLRTDAYEYNGHVDTAIYCVNEDGEIFTAPKIIAKKVRPAMWISSDH